MIHTPLLTAAVVLSLGMIPAAYGLESQPDPDPSLKQTYFVIVASPQQQVAPRTCYIAQDGSITILSSKAVKFSSLADAIKFAEEKRIALNAFTYIDLKDFTDLEMQG